MESPFSSLAVVDYDFVGPARIVFGWGRRREVGSLARAVGDRRAFVFGSWTLVSAGALAVIEQSLREQALEVTVIPTSREPVVTDVDRAVEHLRTLDARTGDVVIAVGGGSVIDLAKAAAALVTNRHASSVEDYLEGVGRGTAITEQSLPFIAMPTTGGTGSEATKNAVISSYNPPYKKSLRSDRMMPRVALVDAELAVSLPAAATAHSGLDAITQCIESYLSRRARPMARALAVDGLRHGMSAIREAVEQPASRKAREAMAHAALMSGLALANSGLGLAHGVASALGAHANVAHGLACAVMLPVALRTNRAACEGEMADLGRALWPDSPPNADEAADLFVERIVSLCDELSIPRKLRDLGVRQEQIRDLVTGSHGNSLDGNPIELSDERLGEILESMW